jgi:hypothetical protein
MHTYKPCMVARLNSARPVLQLQCCMLLLFWLWMWPHPHSYVKFFALLFYESESFSHQNLVVSRKLIMRVVWKFGVYTWNRRWDTPQSNTDRSKFEFSANISPSTLGSVFKFCMFFRMLWGMSAPVLEFTLTGKTGPPWFWTKSIGWLGHSYIASSYCRTPWLS